MNMRSKFFLFHFFDCNLEFLYIIHKNDNWYEFVLIENIFMKLILWNNCVIVIYIYLDVQENCIVRSDVSFDQLSIFHSTRVTGSGKFPIPPPVHRWIEYRIHAGECFGRAGMYENNNIEIDSSNWYMSLPSSPSAVFWKAVDMIHSIVESSTKNTAAQMYLRESLSSNQRFDQTLDSFYITVSAW